MERRTCSHVRSSGGRKPCHDVLCRAVASRLGCQWLSVHLLAPCHSHVLPSL